MAGPGVYAIASANAPSALTVTTETFFPPSAAYVSVAGAFWFTVDLSNMVAGDVLEIRAYKTAASGGTARVLAGYPITFAGAQPTDGKIVQIGPILNSLVANDAVRFSLNQTLGTGRVFPYSVDNEYDGTANVTQLLGTAWLTPGVAGTPDVNVKTINAQTATAAGAVTFPGTIASATNITSASGVTLSATGSVALTEGYAADGVAPTLNQMLYQMWSFLAEKNISGTTMTCKKIDGSTNAMTFTLDSATTPTTITRAT